MTRFGFRQIDYRDLDMFLADGEIRAKNHFQRQACHQTNHASIVGWRGTPHFTLPHGGVVNDYVPFYFSPVTSFTFSVHWGKARVTDPAGRDLGSSTWMNRIFLVVAVDQVFASGLQVSFSNFALNSLAPMPVVVDNPALLNTHVHWPYFDMPQLVCAIPQIGYAGVHGWCQSDTNLGYHTRGPARMAELLVKQAIPMGLVICIITPTAQVHAHVQQKAHQYGFQGLVIHDTNCFRR